MSPCGLDAAPYVLGALEPDEAQAFMRHLDECAVCRDEVASLAPVLEALPSCAPPRPVPAAFRRRVLRAVRAEPKRLVRHRHPVARTGWLAVGLAATAAVLVIAVGMPHTRTRMIQASVGQAAVRVDAGGHAELIVNHLASLPSGRVYELWLRWGSRMVPSTLFDVTKRGRADLGVPGDVHGVSRLLVTVEPSGGSPAPTTPAVIQVPLSYVSRS